MLKKKNLFDILGSTKIASLNSINLNHEFKPVSDGHCQWGAIEAAKVLFDDEYKPLPLSHVPPTYESDPIEDHLGKGDKTIVPCFPCGDAMDLEQNLNALQNGELYIVNGETDDITHAYIILKAEHRFWLIDADRGIFKEVHPDQPEEFICAVCGWEDERPSAYLDYLHLRFVEEEKAENVSTEPAQASSVEESHESDSEETEDPISMYKITSANLALLKKITFSKSAKDLLSDWKSYIESYPWKGGTYTVVTEIGKLKKISAELRDLWKALDQEDKQQDVEATFKACLELAQNGSQKRELNKFFTRIISDQKKYQVSGKVDKVVIHARD